MGKLYIHFHYESNMQELSHLSHQLENPLRQCQKILLVNSRPHLAEG